MSTTISAKSVQSSMSSQVTVTEQRHVKKKKSMRRQKNDSISVSKSSEKLFKKIKDSEPESNPECEQCGRPVYVMERVKAEKRVWHKDCFKCIKCSKQLTVETYQSDHTTLYCKLHFKQLFEPTPVAESDDVPDTVNKHELIICESKPLELPSDVVRASDKPDLGLEELSQLDVKSRFEMFEKNANKKEKTPTPEPRQQREKSAALLSKLAKFKAKGMDIGVSDDYLNGVTVEDSSSEPEDDDEDSLLKKSYKHTNNREQPVSFCNMSEIVGKFENGDNGASERSREWKLELQNIRSRLFMGKNAKIKEMYEQSVLQNEQNITSADKIARELEVDAEKSRAIKQRFESGEVFNDENQPPAVKDIEDKSLFAQGIGKKSRSIFLELDANSKNVEPLSPPPNEPPKRKEIPFIPTDVVRATDRVEDVKVKTADISSRFNFFETYKPKEERKEFRMTPPRQTQRQKSASPEMYIDPEVARESDAVKDVTDAANNKTAARMINVFRQMEQKVDNSHEKGMKPLKCFTPPPPGEEKNQNGAYTDEEEAYSTGSETESEDEEPDNYQDDGLKQAQQLGRTKSFRERFEHWPDQEAQRSPSTIAIERQADEEGDSQLETAKSLRQKFERLKLEQGSSVTKTFATKVNRFV